jgi:metal-dependent hydrolase (beta-lactamase superfamily II)
MDIDVIGSGSSGNAYIISDGYTKVLLECGIKFNKLQRGCGYKLHEIQACLISHGH